MPAPVCGVNIDHDVLVARYDMDVAHLLEPFPYGPDAQGIFIRELAQRQLIVYVIRYYALSGDFGDAHKLTATVKAHVQLTSTPTAILL